MRYLAQRSNEGELARSRQRNGDGETAAATLPDDTSCSSSERSERRRRSEGGMRNARGEAVFRRETRGAHHPERSTAESTKEAPKQKMDSIRGGCEGSEHLGGGVPPRGAEGAYRSKDSKRNFRFHLVVDNIFCKMQSKHSAP